MELSWGHCCRSMACQNQQLSRVSCAHNLKGKLANTTCTLPLPPDSSEIFASDVNQCSITSNVEAINSFLLPIRDGWDRAIWCHLTDCMLGKRRLTIKGFSCVAALGKEKSKTSKLGLEWRSGLILLFGHRLVSTCLWGCVMKRRHFSRGLTLNYSGQQRETAAHSITFKNRV